MSVRSVNIPATAPLASIAVALLCAGTPAQHSAMDLQVVDQATVISDRRGASVPADLRLVDEDGRAVRIGEWFGGERPLILNLGYYGCPSLCGAVLNALVDGLQDVELEIGRDYEVLTVSIDPGEGPELARRKKDAMLEAFGQPAAAEHWHFLTGEEDQVRALAEAVGFGYQWNPFGKVWDHGAGVFLLSPNGEVSQVLQGAYYEPRDLRLGLVEASEGEVGSFFDRVLLTCYGYDPASRSYTLMVWTVVRIGGTLTVLALVVTLLLLWRLERRKRRSEPAASSSRDALVTEPC